MLYFGECLENRRSQVVMRSDFQGSGVESGV